MIEWNTVLPETFVNGDGVSTQVKLRHEPVVESSFVEVDTEGEDIDAIAFKYMGSEFESLRLLEANQQTIVEYDFDMSKIPRIKIPVS